MLAIESVHWNVRQSRRGCRGRRRGKTVLRKRRSLTLLVVLLLLAAHGLHTPDLVAEEALLVLVGVRLGVSLVLVILELGLPLPSLPLPSLPLPPLPLSTETSIGTTMSESARTECEVVPDRGAPDTGLADVVCNRQLATHVPRTS